jgi:hypothetical protein
MKYDFNVIHSLLANILYMGHIIIHFTQGLFDLQPNDVCFAFKSLIIKIEFLVFVKNVWCREGVIL